MWLVLRVTNRLRSIEYFHHCPCGLLHCLQIKDLFQILSAFNLNIEIVAPECLVPDVSFLQKWAVIMAVPIGVYLISASLHFSLVIYRLCIKGQDRKVACGDAGSIALSSILSIFYLMYIYLSKNVFDVMTCVPGMYAYGLLVLPAVCVMHFPMVVCGLSKTVS